MVPGGDTKHNQAQLVEAPTKEEFLELDGGGIRDAVAVAQGETCDHGGID